MEGKTLPLGLFICDKGVCFRAGSCHFGYVTTIKDNAINHEVIVMCFITITDVLPLLYIFLLYCIRCAKFCVEPLLGLFKLDA